MAKNVPEPTPGARPEVEVLKAGWRLGSALRAAQAGYHANGPEGASGWRVPPHLRGPHWHAYWAGPRDKPDGRYIRLHYLPPIQVGKELPSTTVVRPAAR